MTILQTLLNLSLVVLLRIIKVSEEKGFTEYNNACEKTQVDNKSNESS